MSIHFEKASRFVQESSSSNTRMSNRESWQFWGIFGLSQAIGITVVGLIVYWCQFPQYGGFSWSGSNANLQFYFHPTFMVLGLVFFYGDAMIVYRVLRFLPKPLLKMVHAALHLCAIVCSIVGLVAVLEYHRRTEKPDFYSLHSWIGIGTFSLFCFQYIGGFVTFLYPGLPASIRAQAMPFHTFFGSGLFVLAIIAVQTGFTEKLIWTGGYTQGKFPPEAIIGNVVGLAIIVFGFLIIFMATHAPYKRKPLPGEMPNAPAN